MGEFVKGRPPVLEIINGKPVIIKNLTTFGGSKYVAIPHEWIVKNNSPKQVQMTYDEDGKVLKIRPHDKN